MSGWNFAGTGLALIIIACGSSPSSSPFAGGPAQKCQSDADCNNGQTCQKNVCAAEPGATPCETSADCLNGWRCGQGTCYRVGDGGPPGTSGSSGAAGSVSTGGGGSSACSANNRTCSVNADCCGFPDSAFCVDFGGGIGTCAPLCSSNAACTTGCCADLVLNGQPNGLRACAPSTLCAANGGAGGSAGAGGNVATGGVPTGTGGTCSANNRTCNVNGDCCGFPGSSRCVDFGNGVATCAPLCVSTTSCATGCCAPLTDGSSVCAPSAACAGSGGATGAGGASGCVASLGTCNVNGDCCGFPSRNVCWDPLIGTGPVCAIVCTSGAQCASGCCVPLNLGVSACGPASDCP